MTSLWTRAGLTWRQFFRRLWVQIWQDELLGRCAELSYFFLFSVFPLLLFLTTLLGYVAGANDQLRASLFLYLARVSPSPQVLDLLLTTLHEITNQRTGFKLLLSLVAAVWVASNGMLAVSRTLNTACGLKETRPWWQRRLTAVVLTISSAVLITSALFLILYGGAIGNTLAERLGVLSVFTIAWNVLKWPLVLVFVVIGFEMVYNYAPNLGDSPNRRWWTPGAITGVTLWLLASFGFRAYLSFYDAFSKTYGSLGAVIVLLLWFYMTAFAILMGGEVNSEIGRELAEQRRLAAAEADAEEAVPRRRRRWRRR